MFNQMSLTIGKSALLTIQFVKRNQVVEAEINLFEIVQLQYTGVPAEGAHSSQLIVVKGEENSCFSN